ncbi:hypothetical protein AVEN_46572-1 [Araneus ventricosus]|uniref:Peptidase A2 domain-containing protein n=1 Tax=Araneus ventricosus TaxID=182803 RepID=A0A4Y2MJ43_ARAVE|nr:hypothetical protein AVEN_46572-1 [Araneus ventricosus]
MQDLKSNSGSDGTAHHGAQQGKFSGKLERQGVAATYTSSSSSRRLFVRDRKSNVNFLIDTGSDCSLIPASRADKLSVPVQTFLAANGTTINVYKQKLLSLDLGLRKIFVYPFYLCNIRTAIIGADFLHCFNLQPDLRNRRLNDTCTNLNAHGILNKADIYYVKSIFCDDFSKLLNDFPNIVKAPCANQIVKHSVMHHIETFGFPVLAKPRRLAPDHLKTAKMEFQHMLDLGHMRPSNSNYASPLHMVPKKGSDDWCPVGDFRALNAQTKKDKYHIPSV